ncbi:hypothetical protein JOY44_22320 [Phormidium sp. CLA17]|uniref:hypothetical protein n=1 Tax=Leptolyngbya sp. Cla-17 TaxID=2803751 RepID=UPI001838AB00|nr:hypothetical protein [Leptolyngbya sp. Cla-17]MBM0744314.1 hypothetical protein [Leptolyngbya sp. Cla-17]
MSDFEIRANNIMTAIEIAEHRVSNYGYSDDPPEETVSRVIGMFITWLTACEEARQQVVNGNASFTRNVIEALPVDDDPNWDTCIMPPSNSTLKERAQALWGIRVAFTHGDGDITLIKNTQNRQFAINSQSQLMGVSIQNNKIYLRETVCHIAIRTMVQIRDVLL